MPRKRYVMSAAAADEAAEHDENEYGVIGGSQMSAAAADEDAEHGENKHVSIGGSLRNSARKLRLSLQADTENWDKYWARADSAAIAQQRSAATKAGTATEPDRLKPVFTMDARSSTSMPEPRQMPSHPEWGKGLIVFDGRTETTRAKELNVGMRALNGIANLDIAKLSVPDIVDELVRATKVIGHPSTNGTIDDMIIHAVMQKIEAIPDVARWDILAKVFEAYNNNSREEMRKVTNRNHDIQEMRKAMVEMQSDYAEKVAEEEDWVSKIASSTLRVEELEEQNSMLMKEIEILKRHGTQVVMQDRAMGSMIRVGERRKSMYAKIRAEIGDVDNDKQKNPDLHVPLGKSGERRYEEYFKQIAIARTNMPGDEANGGYGSVPMPTPMGEGKPKTLEAMVSECKKQLEML